MTKNSNLTLENIGKLIDEKLDKKFDQKLAPIQYQLTQLLGETTYTRNEVNTLKSDVGSLRSDMNQRFDLVDKRFDKNDRDHEEILDAVKEFVSGGYDLLDKRVAKLESKWYTAPTI